MNNITGWIVMIFIIAICFESLVQTIASNSDEIIKIIRAIKGNGNDNKKAK